MARVVIESVKLDRARPAAAAAESWVVATDLAEALARRGTPFHRAHQIVGRFVLESVQNNKKPADWTADEMRQFAPEFTAEMVPLLDPKKGIESREIPGGTGPGPALQLLAAEFVLDVRCAQNLVVVKTAPGNANSVAQALDQEEWPEVVGTIAGDNNILVIAPDPTTAELIQERLMAILEKG
jgi:hypothetical protein